MTRRLTNVYKSTVAEANSMDHDFCKNKEVLITGGSGFVGRWVGRTLAPYGSKLHILDLFPPNNYEVPFEFHQTDLRDLESTKSLLAKVKPSAIIHLAGQPGVQSSHDNPLGAYEANVLCTFNMLEACRQVGGIESMVAVSSNHVYGEQHKMPTPEDAPLNGTGMYAVSKLCGDVLARTYGKTYGLPVGIARMTNSFGPDDHHTSHIITGTILSCLQGKTPIIKQSGRDRKGYLYIEDTARGLLSVAVGVAQQPNLRGESFNLVPNEAVTVSEVVEQIVRIVGMNESPEVKKPDESYEEEFLDNAKARELLGWSPQMSLSEGLRATISWYRNHR